MRGTLAFLLATLLVIACSRDEPRSEQSDAASEQATETAVSPGGTAEPTAPPRQGRPETTAPPAIESIPCAEFGIGGRVEAGIVACGYLDVPEDRADPDDGRRLRLAVAHYRPAAGRTSEPPLVWLDGGPGGASIEPMALVVGTATGRRLLGGRDLLAERDIVLIDQRGTGFSRPSLACPELEPFRAPGTTVEEQRAAGAARRALFACRDRLTAEGVRLGAYTSATNAADIDDLRRALGVPQVDLYGVSYGTRLALTMMRDFPGSVRAAVLDSPVPVQATLYAEFFTGAERAFDLLFRACAADAVCSARYPALEGTFASLVARLNATPLAVEGGGGAVLTGDDLTAGLFGLLYSTSVIPLVPGLIAALAEGRADGLIALLRQRARSAKNSRAMHYSVQCADELPFTSPASIAAARASVRPEVARAMGRAAEDVVAICAAWPSRPTAAREDEPVRSAIPTLVLAGRHDPITPPAFAARVAETLPNSTTVEFPGVGHGALFIAHPCPHDIVRAFLRNPSAPPDASCAAAMMELGWAGR